MKAVTHPRPTPAAWRDLLRLVIASLATGAAVSVVLALAVFLVATEAHATSVPVRATSVPVRATSVPVRAAAVATVATVGPEGLPLAEIAVPPV